jgi:hypothetical protein
MEEFIVGYDERNVKEKPFHYAKKVPADNPPLQGRS